MGRFVAVVLTVLLAIVTLDAQDTAGWKVRADRSTSASDPDGAGDIKFMAMGAGFHAINPQAAVFWKPGANASGTYTLKGRFTLMKPSDHTNYYGLVFGGSDLEGPQQTYLYFMVAQDGTFLIKRRNGNATEDVKVKEASPAVRRPTADGQSTNELEVRVSSTQTEFVINGTVVFTAPKDGMASRTDGTYGVRINHVMPGVLVENLTLSN